MFYNNPGHISFTSGSSSCDVYFSQKNSINLLNHFNVFDHIPKLFKITTNNGIYTFNTEILIDTSPVIAKVIERDSHQLHYHLSIDDERNIFEKLESLYQGKSVLFDIDDYSILSNIVNTLQIQNFHIEQLLKVDQIFKFKSDNPLSSPKYLNFMISKNDFNHYLMTTAPTNFIISTNKRNYYCNIFGILSSGVIRDCITKNPKTKLYKIDYSDENNDFQLICDLFNFKSIQITSENVEIIYNLTEKLQIDFILDELQKFIDYFEIINKTIDEQQEITDSNEELFEWLYNINKLTVEKVKELIIKSNWIKTEDNVMELTSFIIHVLNSDFQLHQNLADLLIELNKEANEKSNKLSIIIPFLVDKLMNSFASTKLNYSFIYILHKKGIIEKEKILEKISFIIKNNKNRKYLNEQLILKNTILWFLPEIIEIDPYFISNIPDLKSFLYQIQCYDLFEPYLLDQIDLYIKMRDNSEPIDEITKSLRHDDIDNFQRLISSKLDKITNCFVKNNMFENYFPQEETSYINYAAAYGSIKCFKYLLLNHDKIDEFTYNYAVIGGNIEIIKIVDQTVIERKVNIFNPFEHKQNIFTTDDKIYLSIIKHQNDLFDWIYEHKYSNNNRSKYLLNTLAYLSVLSGNTHCLISLIDKGYDFSNNPNCYYLFLQAASRRGFYKMTKLLILLMQAEFKLSKSEMTKFINGHSYTNNDVPFEIQFKMIVQNNINQEMMKYSFESVNEFIFTMVRYDYNFDPINSIDSFHFELSVYFGNISIFNLYKKFMNQIDLENTFIFAVEKNYSQIIDEFLNSIILDGFQINKKFIQKILNASVKRKNDSLFNKLIDTFKQLNPNFLDELTFDFEVLSSACLNQNIDAMKKIFKLNHDEFDDKDLTSLFIKAISMGSIEICKYFVDKKIDLDFQQLFSNDNIFDSIEIKMMSLIFNILSYKYKQKFVGSLIDKEIIKNKKENIEFLLKNKAPMDNALLNAVETHDIETVNIVLKYNSKPVFINKSSSNGTALHIAIKYNDIDIIKRLLSIPGIDLNKIDSNFNTPLKIACDNNNEEVVQILLKNKNIDVNIVSNNGDSLLMNAIKRNDINIAEMLIKHPKTNINNQNFDNKTPLILAVCSNQFKIINLLINDEKFDPEESLLDFAFFISSEETSNFLIKSKFLDVNYFNNTYEIDKYETTLTKAIKSRNYEKVNLIVNHPSFDKDLSQLSTALFYSISNKNITIFKKLLKFANNNDDISESLAFIFSSDLINADQLIKEIIDVNSKNGNFIDFKKLLPNKKSFFTSIPPKFSNIKELVDLFLKNGADPNIPDKNGIYPLQYAIEINSKEFVCSLINSKKIDFNKKIRIKNPKYEEELNDQFVEDLIVFDDKTPKLLTQESVKYTKSKYKTYLHLAARCDNNEILELFLDKNLIDINVIDDIGETPLMESCRYCLINNIKSLFKNDNIDYLHRNNNGEDAIQILSKMANLENSKIFTNNKDDYFKILISALKYFI